MVAVKAALILALLVILGSGCAQQVAEPTGFDEIQVRFKNDGSTSKDVHLTVTGPAGQLLDKRLVAKPGAFVVATIPADERGAYELDADYSQSVTNGGSTQVTSGGQKHRLNSMDCGPGVVTVTFHMSYSQSTGSMRWTHYGSYGTCGVVT